MTNLYYLEFANPQIINFRQHKLVQRTFLHQAQIEIYMRRIYIIGFEQKRKKNNIRSPQKWWIQPWEKQVRRGGGWGWPERSTMELSIKIDREQFEIKITSTANELSVNFGWKKSFHLMIDRVSFLLLYLYLDIEAPMQFCGYEWYTSHKTKLKSSYKNKYTQISSKY